MTILDRDTPIAELVPIPRQRVRLQSIPPEPGAPRFQDVPMPLPLDLGVDVLDMLLQERRNDR